MKPKDLLVKIKKPVVPFRSLLQQKISSFPPPTKKIYIDIFLPHKCLVGYPVHDPNKTVMV